MGRALCKDFVLSVQSWRLNTFVGHVVESCAVKLVLSGIECVYFWCGICAPVSFPASVKS